ncbi:unnamed protein product [Brachionus calyciflorus]|uniref:Uncharacterized protein n=1 Tax=Brachionus calyciflorus TaxID=104777 RepID=A0A814JRS9_9BILA|nr:unnamed protein product [Brachionus calyciflorus]
MTISTTTTTTISTTTTTTTTATTKSGLNKMLLSTEQMIQKTINAPVSNDQLWDTNWWSFFNSHQFLVTLVLFFTYFDPCVDDCMYSILLQALLFIKNISKGIIMVIFPLNNELKYFFKENKEMIRLNTFKRTRSKYHSIDSSLNKYNPHMFATFKPTTKNIPRSISNGSYFKVQNV